MVICLNDTQRVTFNFRLKLRNSQRSLLVLVKNGNCDDCDGEEKWEFCGWTFSARGKRWMNARARACAPTELRLHDVRKLKNHRPLSLLKWNAIGHRSSTEPSAYSFLSVSFSPSSSTYQMKNTSWLLNYTFQCIHVRLSTRIQEVSSTRATRPCPSALTSLFESFSVKYFGVFTRFVASGPFSLKVFIFIVQNRNRYFVSQFEIGLFCFTFISVSVEFKSKLRLFNAFPSVVRSFAEWFSGTRTHQMEIAT